jgi:cytochrome c oxidase subunit 3
MANFLDFLYFLYDSLFDTNTPRPVFLKFPHFIQLTSPTLQRLEQFGHIVLWNKDYGYFIIDEEGTTFLYDEIRGFNAHPYHLVDPSPWPFFVSFAALVLICGLVLYFHSYMLGLPILLFGLVFLLFIMGLWWRDIVREGTFRGHHTLRVAKGLRLGVVLFIVSEIMFFFSFFWAFLHSSLSPSIEIGGIWPPQGLEVLNPFGVPLINTLILLTSGATLTYAHYSIITCVEAHAKLSLITTILLAILFTVLQFNEYVEAPFNLSDGIYASTFFLATGFHGLHVVIGTTFLLVCLVRVVFEHFSPKHHVGLEAAIWYWHFVDVVWLFLFLLVYVWGSY